jgi:hypothetical protein
MRPEDTTADTITRNKAPRVDIDFLVIGTAKAGTTSLYTLLGTHPRICLSRPKETWFFDGSEQARSIDRYVSNHFSHCGSDTVRGEIATSYLYVPYVAERIALGMPHTRLIAILRDPIERAYSDWWMMHSRGWDPLSFDAAISANLKRLEEGPDFSDPRDWVEHLAAIRKSGQVRYRTYVDYGFYGAQLSRYLEQGFHDRLLVLQFEQMKQRGVSYLERVFSFLGLEPPAAERLEEQFAYPQNLALPSRTIGRLVSFMHKLGVARHVPPGMKRAAKDWLANFRDSDPMSAETRSLLQAIYQSRMDGLDHFPELDLSLWPSLRR